MKRMLSLLILLCMICVLFSGCDVWMDGSYVSVTPHLEQNLQTRDEVVEVSSYVQIQENLALMVETGAVGGVMSLSGMDAATASEHMDVAEQYLKKNHPISAYAVEDISYDMGASGENTIVAYQINYYHGRSEILRIQKTESIKEAQSVIAAALEDFDSSLVLLVSDYETVDFTQMVYDYAYDNPSLIMEIPDVKVSLYPDSGTNRVVALSFTYQTSTEVLRQMQERVEQVFLSADLYVKGAAQISEIYLRLYSFLMERYDYTVETSITPSYSLLLHGVGDSRAFANVYAAMCRTAELDCKVITGTRNGIPWSWNLVRLRDEYYHVDLLECDQNGEFRMLTSAEMVGYVWDYSAYNAS